jgi:uncharacterized membrane protein
MENVIELEKKNQKIIKFNIWYALCYFIFYSFIGFLLETGFGLFTKGVIESRQSFLFGPFCIIYGIGALLIITFLSSLKDKPIRLFFASCLLGATTEYLMSYFCEKIFHFKWWDYTGMSLNINGRTCLYFTAMWGILGIVLIKFVNPLLDKFFNFIKQKIDKRILKTVILLSIVFLIFDASISFVALKSFYSKVVTDFDLDLKSGEYAGAYIQNDLFEEDNMLLTYPNMQIAGTKYNNTYIDNLYKNKKTYFFKVFEK